MTRRKREITAFGDLATGLVDGPSGGPAWTAKLLAAPINSLFSEL
jgi:hypothetical protein